ncbi:MAG: hypothetical protein M1294_12590 [Firmicutes bacterium]|uniref:Lipoprotein with Yx(FWY)xxD motif n=1 Tax=Sulfobacillus benefaciens TaxID=453960 RepID=A0A2T2X9X8_9FIRM|nr:hypothetical protein [Bacillota bacterium]MCL5015390.1 hypothetical protein [Bacillota bacterium]PSR31289.1 MAG: hypothetical protein C7B43_02665 [Sulfobacillus benefaciens]
MHEQKQQKSLRGNSYKWAISLGVVSLILAGCGTTTAAARPSSTKSSSPQATATTSSSASLKVGNALVQGKKTPVLENAKGMTLYYFTKDTPTQSNCTNNHNCDTIWHALTSSSSHVSASGLSGKVTVVNDVHGKQIAYNGHLLYLYSGDTKPGQALGEGFLHTWWVATPTLKPLTASHSSSSSNTSSSKSGSSAYGSGGSSSSSSSSSSSGW